MATREQIEALKIDENVFELAEDTELEFLVHFAAPFTGSDKCLVPEGTAFAPHCPMRGDALYMHLVDEDNEELYAKMEAQVKAKYVDLFTRLQGFSFFITEEQLKTLPLKFRNGSAECLLEIMCSLRSAIQNCQPKSVHYKFNLRAENFSAPSRDCLCLGQYSLLGKKRIVKPQRQGSPCRRTVSSLLTDCESEGITSPLPSYSYGRCG